MSEKKRAPRRKGIIILVLLCLAVLGLVLTMMSIDSDPPDDADLFPPPRRVLADAQNAFLLVVQAGEAVNEVDGATVVDVLGGLQDLISGGGDSAGTPATSGAGNGSAKAPSREQLDEQARRILEANTRALELLGRALERPHYQPPALESISDADPAVIMMVSDLTDLLHLRSVERQLAGDMAGALEDVHLMFELGARLCENPEVLVDYLVGAAVIGTALERMKELIPQELDDTELRRLAERIDRAGSLRAGLALALQHEYRLTAGYFDSADKSLTYKPNRTRHRLAEFYRACIERTRKVDWFSDSEAAVTPEPRTGLDKAGDFFSGNSAGEGLVDLVIPTLDSCFRRVARLEALTSFTRVLIALRRHTLKHGTLPATLAELVPEFLETIPRDPFDGKPLRYSREKRILYSVGEDRIDEGGLSEEAPMDTDEPTVKIGF